ncbi:monofunctional biosynthetic peptidoglycan transglycosylase [Massilia antarctica]|uniref:monofunctional biosynthetic peptidoglycan transglycosylase n=1 Tax=Massilia antarctica TaxID=2765360 RepID=UPI0006BB63B5|nr:monofunctional biosynthetic peptidoglycan transglycosylase [Massilia sp. H27-R4]MCY0913561.1 monofunctional biosynthetic peptidoglycan transglycosylase [Massilia sp. H27-R4]CUI09710.1 Monofunctional biosynthetic peptidoglycan transglycosylase [Janthinobacterium sp. CG23_2]CUU33496.1 Monofunctional biosynthetic peptidoglycan transglycosylase [Janthinobacterium sp. CG23_2]
MSKGGKAGGRRWVKWIFLGPLLLIVLIQLYFFLMVCWWSWFNPSTTSMMSDQLALMREKNPKAVLQQQWVPYERISENLKRAVIASEDANFSEHDGVDWEALQKAYERNNRKHKVVGGGSTITQQLAKNLFLSGSRSYLRKGQEMIIAFMLETVMSKQRILEIYLNVAEFGRGIFGAEAASRYYYRTSAANLGVAQAAKLAVMLPNPRYYDRHRSSSYLAQRTTLIVNRMSSAELP